MELPLLSSPQRNVLVIGCGALAREIADLRRMNNWTAIDVVCLPAELHNRPERIAPTVREQIRAQRDRYCTIFVAYGECGTGGQLDAVLAEEDIERIPGAHCYEFFAGSRDFAALSEAEPGTFYLTDFLVRHFDRLVTRGLGLDRHPELASEYFRHYRKLVFLAQTRVPATLERARQIAQNMRLQFEHRFTGYGGLGQRLQAVMAAAQAG
jgi:hypothetical protein